MSSYSTKSIGYLARAREMLDVRDNQSLFYAAFELRCGIEARLKEYFDAQAETTKKKRKGWEIDKLAKQVEDVFQIGNRHLDIVIFDAYTKETIASAKYTAVTPELQKMGQRLGDYLHSQDQNKINDPEYWKKMKGLLEMTYQELGFATSGTLLAPPLVYQSGKNPVFFCLTDDQRNLFPPGKHVGMHYKIYELEPLEEKDF